MTAAFEIPKDFINLLDTTELPETVFTSPIQAISGREILTTMETEARDLFRQAVDSIKIIRSKYMCVNAVSFGKDSETTLLAALCAHEELIAEGVLKQDAPLVVTNINTKVENHLIQMLVYYEVSRLEKYGKENNLNIDIRIGKPPLAKQWASLFLSGIKIISSARTNNDCSVIMKIENAEKIERQVKKDYGEDIVTLLGVRLDESTKRAASVKKYNMDNMDPEALIELDENDDKVFAPIVNMTTDHVWTILRQAGTHPIQKSSLGLNPIPSYAKNHRLLHLIYSDSSDGSCPTSAKRIKGEKQSVGGCGQNARTGCFLCAKSTLDKSGEAQSKQKRHSVISGNILKVRNYIMSVAQDSSKRTWHSRAFDQTTGAIALQPNVLNAETLDKILWLLSQATWDEQNRAKKFASLVSQGREMEDEGYADIMSDPLLDPEDRDEMAYVYKEFATSPLIEPMSLDIAIYLSAIHARDGMRLPPYRALHIWFATSKGERIPYPDVDLSKAVIDDIPDSVMVLPRHHDIAIFTPFTGDNLYDVESIDGCEGESKIASSSIPAHQAKYYLPELEQHKLIGKKPNDLIEIRGLETSLFTKKIRKNPISHNPKLRYSKRAITKVSKKGGGYKILERGRTSLGSYSFGLRDTTAHLEQRLSVPINIGLPTIQREYNPLEEAIDYSSTGYQIDHYALDNWTDYEGLEKALEEHDEFVRLHESWGEDIFYFGGTAPLEHFLRWGVIRLGKLASENAARILTRTAYYNALGLLAINDDAVRKLALNKNKTFDISEYRRGIKANIELQIKEVLSMQEYRKHKAGVMIKIRNERNKNRIKIRSNHELLVQDPVAFAIKELKSIFNTYSHQYSESIETMVLTKGVIDDGVRFFDGQSFYNRHHTNKGFKEYFYSIFTDLDSMLYLFDKSVKKVINHNPQERQKLIKAGSDLAKELLNIESQTINIVMSNIENKKGQSLLYYLVADNDKRMGFSSGYAISMLKSLTTSIDKAFNRGFKLNDCVAGTKGIAW
jgi:DNA sulfur modification protein DndC